MRMYCFGINLIFTSVIIFAGMVVQPQTRRPIAGCRIGHWHFETTCIVSSTGLHVLSDRQYPFLGACDLLPCQSCTPSPTSFGTTKGCGFQKTPLRCQCEHDLCQQSQIFANKHSLSLTTHEIWSKAQRGPLHQMQPQTSTPYAFGALA